MVTQEDIHATLQQYMSEQLLGQDVGTVAIDADLWEEGLVDSMGLVELMSFLEEHYAIAIPLHVLSTSEFMSISGMAIAVEELCRAKE